MKKILYTLFFFLGTSFAMAQENRGTLIPAKIFQRSLMVGGNITGAYKSSKNHYNDETSSGKTVRQQIDVAAKVGYFVLNDVALGGKVALNHYRQKSDGDETAIRRTYLMAGPFARYYLNNGLYGEGSFAMGVNNKAEGSKSDIYEMMAGIGYAYFINPKIALEPAVHFSYLREKQYSGGVNYTSELGPTLSLGLQIYLYRERGLAAMR